MIKGIEKKNIFISLLLIAISIVLIIEPEKFIKIVIIGIGIVLAVDGAINIISYVFKKEDSSKLTFNLLEGILELIASLLIIFKGETLISVFPIVLGIVIIFINVLKFVTAISLRKIENSGWKILLITSIVALLLGILIVFNPFDSIKLVIIISGIIMLISELISLIQSLRIVSLLNKSNKLVTVEK